MRKSTKYKVVDSWEGQYIVLAMLPDIKVLAMLSDIKVLALLPDIKVLAICFKSGSITSGGMSWWEAWAAAARIFVQWTCEWLRYLHRKDIALINWNGLISVIDRHQNGTTGSPNNATCAFLSKFESI